MSSSGSPLKLCAGNGAAMMRGSSCCAGRCVVFGWGSSGGSSGSSNGESDSGDSVIELSEEGVDMPVDDGVMVAALS